jgi:hypothetical protein
MLVVMPPDEGNRLFRRYSVDDGEEGQGCTDDHKTAASTTPDSSAATRRDHAHIG